MKRRAVLAAAMAVPSLARAQQGWAPDRPIRWIVGFAPGGVGDLSARLVAQKMTERLGQPVLVENRPSAGGIVAAEAVARAAPDGHTILLMTTTDSTASAVYRQLPYDVLRDFEFVSQMAFFDHVLAVGAQSPYRTLAEFIAAAKARPGAANIGSVAVGGAQNLGAELFRSMAGLDMTVVAYRGTPDLLNAATSGDVHLISEILAPVLPQLVGGRMRLLAIASPQRFPGLPEVPTAEEAGLPGYVVRSWNGIAAPARTPPAAVARIGAELARALALPEVRSRLLELGVQPAPGSTEEFRSFVTAENARWARVVADANIPRQ
jgi:tripartite-type tricarboxylate transporter receptor subunit TctC